MIEATLKLFNAIPVIPPEKVENTPYITKDTVDFGYFLDKTPQHIPFYSIHTVIGRTARQYNAAFHKSWDTVKNSTDEELLAHQLLHYMSTYGFERMGIYSENTVYIPNEALDIPIPNKGIRLHVIHVLTMDEIIQKIATLVSSGVALSEETLECIMDILIENPERVKSLLDQAKNKEFKARVYARYDMVPNDPTEYLRYLIYVMTGESLIIKSKGLITKIKESSFDISGILEKAPVNLASIFHRNKPLFLAMKSQSKNKNFFNRLRKDANSKHIPMPEDVLNSVTRYINKGESFDLTHALSKANVFRRVRLYNSLRIRQFEDDAIVYRIRNGKSFATEMTRGRMGLNFILNQYAHAEVEKIVMQSIIESIGENFAGKKFYIPRYVHYTLPSSEKQFTGNFPSGTYFDLYKNATVGIHWFNVEGNRVDLDLSAVSCTEKIGWDANLRGSHHGNVWFSGDITNAPKPNGAAEFFMFGEQPKEAYILYVNYFNHRESDNIQVPMDIIIGQSKTDFTAKKYVFNRNDLIGRSQVTIEKKQNILGLIHDRKFYFYQTAMGEKITSSDDKSSGITRRFFKKYVQSNIMLEDVIKAAMGEIVREKTDDCIDLSPENIDKTSILNLLKNNGGI